MKKLEYLIVFVYSAVLFFQCGPRIVDNAQRGGSGTETVGIVGFAVDTNENPVAGATVKLRRADYLDTVSAALQKKGIYSAEATTDEQGKFSIGLVDTGAYTIEINDGKFHGALLRCTVGKTDSPMTLPQARLRPTGSLFGIIPPVPQTDSLTFSIFVYGLADHRQTSGRRGEFTITDIPPGSYTIKIIPAAPLFAPLDTAVGVTSGQTDTIGQLVPERMSFSINPLDSCVLQTMLDSMGLHSVAWRQVASVGPWPFRITELKLDYKKITALPAEIGGFKELQVLSAQGNYLSGLPKEIGSLRHLKTLSVGNNVLTSLPQEINELDSLVNLNVSYNQLSALPNQMDNCRSLKVLDAGYNQIASIPEEVFYCHSLQAVILCSNSLDSLPQSIGFLWNLNHLEAQNNALWTLPWQITKLRSEHLFVNFDYNALCDDVGQDVANWLNSVSASWQTTQMCH
jgi:hypothetical protein